MKIIKCPDCKGKGKRYVFRAIFDYGWTAEESCRRCDGLGVLKISIDDIKDAREKKHLTLISVCVLKTRPAALYTACLPKIRRKRRSKDE